MYSKMRGIKAFTKGLVLLCKQCHLNISKLFHSNLFLVLQPVYAENECVLNVPVQHLAFSLGPTPACLSSVWSPRHWHWGSGIWGWRGHTLGSGSSSRQQGCSPRASLTDVVRNKWIISEFVCSPVCVTVHSCQFYIHKQFFLPL